MGHTYKREFPAQQHQVPPPPHSLPDVRMVTHRTGEDSCQKVSFAYILDSDFHIKINVLA